MSPATLNTDFNEHVLFDPATLQTALQRSPADEEDLYRWFTTTEQGNQVPSPGAILPVLGVTDEGYAVFVRSDRTANPFVSLDRSGGAAPA
jgi:hypothetical protein